MRPMTLAVSLALAGTALAQPRRPIDPQEPGRRAQAARVRLASSPAGRIVLRSTERHGGLEAWFAGRALRFHYAYVPLGKRPARRSLQTVDLLASRAYHEMSEPAQGRMAWDGQRAWSTFPPAAAAPRFWALTPYYFVAMPFVLGDPGVRLALSADEGPAAGLPPADVVRVTYEAGTGDAPDDYYVAYFARDDGRLLAVRYVVSYAPFMRAGMKHTPEKLLVYEDLKPAGPLTLARSHLFFAFAEGKRGDLVTRATVSQVAYQAPFDEAMLDLPPGAHIDTALKP